MSWGTGKLGEVCIIEKGNIGIMKAVSGEYPLVVLGEERKSHNEYQFDDEAVIIPLVSSTGHGHKSLKRIHFQKGKFAVGSILCAVIPIDKTKLSAEFLYRYLDLNKEGELVSRMKGMANVSLPIKEIASIEIPLPSLEEQKEIIYRFQKLETFKNQILTELNQQLLLVKELRRCFLQEAIQGKIVPKNLLDESAAILLKKIKAEKDSLIAKKKIKGDTSLPPIKTEEIPFEIPSNWSWCRLGQICIKIGSGSTPRGSDYSKSGILFFRSQNVYNEGIVFSDTNFISEEVHRRMNGTKVIANDILLNITGGSLGRCALVPKDFVEGNVSQHVCIIRPTQVSTTFLHKAFLSPYFQDLIFASTTGAGREGLPKNNLEQFLLPLPPLAEQVRIIDKLEVLMKYCDRLEQNIEQAIANAETLLQVSLKEALGKPSRTDEEYHVVHA